MHSSISIHQQSPSFEWLLTFTQMASWMVPELRKSRRALEFTRFGWCREKESVRRNKKGKTREFPVINFTRIIYLKCHFAVLGVDLGLVRAGIGEEMKRPQEQPHEDCRPSQLRLQSDRFPSSNFWHLTWKTHQGFKSKENVFVIMENFFARSASLTYSFSSRSSETFCSSLSELNTALINEESFQLLEGWGGVEDGKVRPVDVMYVKIDKNNSKDVFCFVFSVLCVYRRYFCSFIFSFFSFFSLV